MKFTEGGFRDWGYALAKMSMAQLRLMAAHGWKLTRVVTRSLLKIQLPMHSFQQILLRPDEYSVVATLNPNGDYISDALAAIVEVLVSLREVTSTITPVSQFSKNMEQRLSMPVRIKQNPGSVILSGVMMLEYMGWQEAADLIIKGLEGAISSKKLRTISIV